METNQQSKAPVATKRTDQGMCLLVVEDHGDLSAALKAFFHALGYRARFVGDVSAALRAAEEEPFNVLLSDIALPDGNGWDLLRQLNDAGRQPMLAIAMSGFGSAEDLARSKAAGFALHLVKPFVPENLVKALATAGLVPTPVLRPPAKRKVSLRQHSASPQSTASFYVV